MITADENGEQERAAALELITAEPLYDGVDHVTIELGDDHTGDPSMWVVFHLRAGFQADEPWVISFSDYSTKLGLKLLHSGLSRFPYTRIKRAA